MVHETPDCLKKHTQKWKSCVDAKKKFEPVPFNEPLFKDEPG